MTGILVVAKTPVAGVAKTRLAAEVGDETAADLAAASLLDTMSAAEAAFSPGRRVLALSGPLGPAARRRDLERRLAHWVVIPQRGQSFGERLAAAHRDAAMMLGPCVVQIGMDTPQVRPTELTTAATLLRESRAVVGLAPDGGWWLLAVRRPEYAEVLAHVTMSSPQTGADTVAALRASGLEVAFAAALRDVDTADDARAVSDSAPTTRFGQAFRRLGQRQLVGGPG